MLADIRPPSSSPFARPVFLHHMPSLFPSLQNFITTRGTSCYLRLMGCRHSLRRRKCPVGNPSGRLGLERRKNNTPAPMAPLLPSSTPLAETIWRLERMPLDPKQDMEKEMHMQPSNHLEGDPPPTSNKIPLFTALSTLNLAMRISPCPRPPEKITPETGVLKKDLQQLDAPPRRSTSNTPTQSTRSI